MIQSHYNWDYYNCDCTDEDEEAIDEDLTEYEEGVAEIDQEEFPDEEEEEEEEEEEDARHRLKTNIIEKYDEQTESILNIQVLHNINAYV